jgi:Chromo (CHRromatin Organisation MOdifier) domain
MNPVEEDDVFAVERVHNDRVRRGRREYHVEWEHYPDPREWTWEPANKLFDENGDEYIEVKNYWLRKQADERAPRTKRQQALGKR